MKVMGEFSIMVDWQEEYKNPDKWQNHGRRVLEENCEHKDHDSENNVRYQRWCEACGVSEDSGEPMMNFAYPLGAMPSDERILSIVQKTNCTVMENTVTGGVFLVLTGGGMNLSQDIALAYILAGEWIPFELACYVSTQPDLSVSGKDFRKVMRECKKTIKAEIARGGYKIKEINQAIKNSKKKDLVAMLQRVRRMEGCNKCYELSKKHNEKCDEVLQDKEYIALQKEYEKLEIKLGKIESKMWRIHDRIAKQSWIEFVEEYNSHVREKLG